MILYFQVLNYCCYKYMSMAEQTYGELQNYGSNTILCNREFILVVIECSTYNNHLRGNRGHHLQHRNQLSSNRGNHIQHPNNFRGNREHHLQHQNQLRGNRGNHIQHPKHSRGNRGVSPIATTTRVKQYNTLQRNILGIAMRWVRCNCTSRNSRCVGI